MERAADPKLRRELSAHLLRLRRRHPFFAALSMFARYVFDPAVDVCDTDGQIVRIDPASLQRLPAIQRTALLLHVTLHAALLHPIRRGQRLAPLWNTAADIVVNNLILETGHFEPPAGTAVEPAWDGLSVEQVYERLLALPRQHPKLVAMAQQMEQGATPGTTNGGMRGQAAPQPASFDAKPGSCSGGRSAGDQRAYSGNRERPGMRADDPRQDAVRVAALRYPARADLQADGRADQQPERDRRRQAHKTTAHWRAALRKAEAVARLSGDGRGNVPAGMQREFDAALAPRLDWRTQLWRYLARTPTDFSGFDRRFVHQGLYLDALEGESLTVHVAVDTSGSVDDRELSEFLAEVRGVQQAYVGIDVQLYFADVGVYGPYPLSDTVDLPIPVGGGGTDFRPFFETVSRDADPFEQTLLVYLTDGDGEFPDPAPEQETLWLVTAGGMDYFPFGEVVRLADDLAMEA